MTSITEIESKVTAQLLIVTTLKAIATMKKEIDDLVYTAHNKYTLPYNYDSFMESIDNIYKETGDLLNNIPI